MCVDFTSLNKAFLNDSYPLPRIDMLIDSTTVYQLLIFLNAYQAYNQIKLDPEDQERTSFTSINAHSDMNLVNLGQNPMSILWYQNRIVH